MKKRSYVSLSVVAVLLCGIWFVTADRTPTVSGGVTEIMKYGNLVLDIPAAALTDEGWTYGDILSVTVDGDTCEMPLCTNYSDVDTGLPLLCDRDGTLVVAINTGDFASEHGVAVKSRDAADNVNWTVSGGCQLSDLSVRIRLAEAGGYRAEYLARQLARTYVREDYASDAVYANFRAVSGGTLGENVLYRSTSPIDDSLSRAAYAERLAEEAGIQTVLNLADSEEELIALLAEGNAPYYRSLREDDAVKALSLGMDFTAPDEQRALADGLRFLISHDGPYLLHCVEGKDRTGFVCVLLAAYMGADYGELAEDYMLSFENFYHLEPTDEQYELIRDSNLEKMLCVMAGTETLTDFQQVDPAAAARHYLEEIGLTDGECAALTACLSTGQAAG